MSAIAYFDFDKTIINRDCVSDFIAFLFRRSLIRASFIVALLPLLMLLSVHRSLINKRNNIIFWVATLGMTPLKLMKVKSDFYDYFTTELGGHAYAEALEVIESHHKQGHDVVVITSALEWMAQDLCNMLGVRASKVIGSRSHKRLLGELCHFTCNGKNKVKALENKGLVGGYDETYAYSDSLLDAPLLNLAQRKVVVNATKECVPFFDRYLAGHFETVCWRH